MVLRMGKPEEVLHARINSAFVVKIPQSIIQWCVPFNKSTSTEGSTIASQD